MFLTGFDGGEFAELEAVVLVLDVGMGHYQSSHFTSCPDVEIVQLVGRHCVFWLFSTIKVGQR